MSALFLQWEISKRVGVKSKKNSHNARYLNILHLHYFSFLLIAQVYFALNIYTMRPQVQ